MRAAHCRPGRALNRSVEGNPREISAVRVFAPEEAQLNAAAAFLAKALARFPDGASRDLRKVEAIARLEAAGKTIGAEVMRRSKT